MPTALNFFGDNKEAVLRMIATRIREARINCGFWPEELGAVANLKKPSVILDLENQQFDPSTFGVSELMSVVTQLGLTVERLLPFREKPNDTERMSWQNVILESGAGPVM